MATGKARNITPLAVHWDAADVAAGNRLAVVLIDQSGTLSATAHGSGTVTHVASNILVLDGDATDLAAELASFTVEETLSGPDTLDVQVFGLSGRLSDNQIALYAAGGSVTGTLNAASERTGLDYRLHDTKHGQCDRRQLGNTKRDTYLEHDGRVIQQRNSNISQSGRGPRAIGRIRGGRRPGALIGSATSAVSDVFDPKVDNPVFQTGGYANNSGINKASLTPLSGYLLSSFNASASVTALVVQSTVRTFDPLTGRLQTSTDTLAPNPVTVTDLTGSHLDIFATAFNQGGRQVIEYNTGNNLNWQAGWTDQFSSATLTYDSNGGLVELLLQGGPDNPSFSINNVFDPNGGELWEQFQTTSPPAKAANAATYTTTNSPYVAGFASGPEYQSQFNKNNPNWGGLDWGTAPRSVTELWTDSYITNCQEGFFLSLPANAPNGVSAYTPQFVNGNTIDLIDLPGEIDINLNALNTVIIDSQTFATSLTNLSRVDAWGSTGSVRITGLAAGHSTLIGGDQDSTLVGYGGDTLIAGAGLTTIKTGAGGSTVQVSSATGSCLFVR